MSSSLLLSFELVYLINWLLKNEKTKLKLLVKNAIDKGVATELQNMDAQVASEKNDELQVVFLDFVDFLEATLKECMKTETKVNREVKENILSDLRRLNVSNVDSNTLWSSITQVENEVLKHKKGANSQHDIKEIFLEKLLKNWNPGKDQIN